MEVASISVQRAFLHSIFIANLTVIYCLNRVTKEVICTFLDQLATEKYIFLKINSNGP